MTESALPEQLSQNQLAVVLGLPIQHLQQLVGALDPVPMHYITHRARYAGGASQEALLHGLLHGLNGNLSFLRSKQVSPLIGNSSRLHNALEIPRIYLTGLESRYRILYPRTEVAQLLKPLAEAEDVSLDKLVDQLLKGERQILNGANLQAFYSIKAGMHVGAILKQMGVTHVEIPYREPRHHKKAILSLAPIPGSRKV